MFSSEVLCNGYYVHIIPDIMKAKRILNYNITVDLEIKDLLTSRLINNIG